MDREVFSGFGVDESDTDADIVISVPPDATVVEPQVVSQVSEPKKPGAGRVHVANPPIAALFSAVLYYMDLGTDIQFASDLHACANDKESGNADLEQLFFVVVAVIAIHPFVLSVLDLFSSGGRGWKGVVMNFTFTRVILAVCESFFSGSGAAANAAARSAVREILVKLFVAAQWLGPFGGLRLYIYWIGLSHSFD
jgi:hypothetical protein